MAFNISTFRSTIAEKGLLPANKFMLRLTTPSGLANTSVQAVEINTPAEKPLTTARSLEFFCDSVTLPGITTLSSDNIRYGYGPIDKKPFSQTFSDMACTFLVDGNGDNIRFFHAWKKLIINNDVRKTMKTATGLVKDQFPFEVAYKEDYAVDMQLLIYNGSGTPKDSADANDPVYPSMTFTFQEAFPITVFDTPMNWADNNNIMRFAVIFTYRTFFEETMIYNSGNDHNTNKKPTR